MELIKQLTDNLGVTDDQAKGGAGMIFKLAKEKLGGDFSQVANAVPGMDDMLSAAGSNGGGGMLGSVTSALGGGGLGNLAGLVGGFSKMGLDGDMVGKFVPIILSFVQAKGGDMVKGLLEKALK